VKPVKRHARLLSVLLGLFVAACAAPPPAPPPPAGAAEAVVPAPAASPAEARLAIYAPVDLEVDLGGLSLQQVEIVRLLIRASEVMDALFWEQAWGDREALLGSIGDEATRRFAELNYGPWDRLDADRPFVEGVGPKPPGARFYPADMSREEFEAWDDPDKTDLYTLVRRDPDGRLYTVPYHLAWQQPLGVAARMLARAAELTRNESFRRYLSLRARALITDDYYPSDLAWMDMKDNDLDVVIGPIETYEDQLFGYKAAFESYVLLKDWEWSARLARFAVFLPELQKSLPVSEAFKAESPGTDSELNAYDVLYYAGRSNAGSKTIAINLPNDEHVQLEKGSRRLQLKNAMRAKFDTIMLPIAGELIAADQRRHVSFDAFFGNTMFHEVAHGLGVKHTVNGRGTVREALQEYAASMEENKADVLGLWMIGWLHERGELPGVELMDYYVTFLAGIFRSVRFGATSAHGRANMVRFNFFRDWGAFHRDADGHYRVDEAGMRAAIEALASQILVIQGSGDYRGAAWLTENLGVVDPALQADLDRLGAAGIPVDVVFRQGEAVLDL
jgi:hypothetical protein